MASRRRQHEQREALEKERDERIHALLADDQKEEYDALLQEYASKLAALTEERKQWFQKAMEQTKEILTEAQRQKYEELLKKQAESRQQRSKGMGAPSGSSETTPQRGE
jgi:Spy/CpxP family protein refolding chaperone